ncbi:hypothetical protein QDW14_01170 [Corynebacterium bovis]|uniref:hypothetical protein n=1 Tax=Corynebacterium bovis TaxID=36808 RepID=UPI0024484C5C|nr:hypothetical protein [Corynebacterium bovis]MDH2455092.1 hypothetical protein [Corynebacterium bovis]
MAQDRPDYSDLDRGRVPDRGPGDRPRGGSVRAGRAAGDGTAGRVVPPVRSSGLSLAALIIAILALPAAMLPLIGLVTGVVAVAVALVALILAMRRGRPRGYAIAALVMAAFAVAVAAVVTNAAGDVAQRCAGMSGDALTRCREAGGQP